MVETLLALEAGARRQPDAIDSLFRDAHSIKGSAGMVGLEEVRAIAHAIEDALEDARTRGEFSTGAHRSDAAGHRRAPRAVGGESGHGERGAAGAVGGDRATRRLRAGRGGPAAAAEPTSAAAPKAPERRSMRMSAEKVDRLLDAVGETRPPQPAARARAGSDAAAERDGRARSRGSSAAGELLLDELQDSVIEMRTLPLSSITGRFPRAVRDLAAERRASRSSSRSAAPTRSSTA